MKHIPSSQQSRAREGRDRWLLSYGDFMTLLLALFVVLYASARADADKSATLLDGIQSAFRFDTPPAIIAQVIPVDTLPDVERENETTLPEPPLVLLEQRIAAAIREEESTSRRSSGTTLHQSERGLVLSLASAEFFPEGGVSIPDERRNVLATLAPLLAAHPGSVHFEGHTDAQPIASEEYPSNWELSTARAAAVARLFIEDHSIDPRRVATTGYAEYRPLPDTEKADQQARNRRVEIVILEDGDLIANSTGNETVSELDRLLDVLPPLPKEADSTLKAEDLGPLPPDIPLP